MPMTPAEFKQARQTLGLTQAQLALVLGYGTPQISFMETGANPIRRVVKIAVLAMVAGYRPDGWPNPA